jgi:ribosome biogenesis protein ERB1
MFVFKMCYTVSETMFYLQDLRNTVGNIPMNWYDDYPHIGYDLEGKPILKPKRGDEIDNFLRKMENPESW